MNLIEAIKIYTHLMQSSGGGIDGRNLARNALSVRNVPENVIEFIARSVSNEGMLLGQHGEKFSLTEISKS